LQLVEKSGFLLLVGLLKEQATATAKDLKGRGLKDPNGCGRLSSSGFFAALRMTAGTCNGKGNNNRRSFDSVVRKVRERLRSG
jgi:hypothetical protein